MKLALLALSALVTAGCGSSSPGDDANIKAGSGVALNPGGQPQNAATAAYAQQMRQMGASINADRARQGAAMAAARARTGGK